MYSSSRGVVCLTASWDWSQSGVLRSSDFGSHAMQGQEIVIGVQPGMLVRGYTTYGKGDSSGEGYTRIGGSPGPECEPPNYCG